MSNTQIPNAPENTSGQSAVEVIRGYVPTTPPPQPAGAGNGSGSQQGNSNQK